MRQWLCTERMIALTRWVLIMELVVGGTYFLALRPLIAQTFPDPIPVMVERVSDLRARMDASEQMVRTAIVELAVLKDNMIEVKWLGRAVAGAIVGQLLIGWMGARTRRRRADQDDDSGPIVVHRRHR